MEVIVSDLIDQYAIVTEAEFATDAIAAATAGGAALPTSTWAAFAAALIGESAEIRAATGVPGDRLALTTASLDGCGRSAQPEPRQSASVRDSRLHPESRST